MSVVPAVERAPLEAAYLRRVQVDSNALPLAVIDPRAVERTQQRTMELLAVYVALETETRVPVEAAEACGKRRRPGKRPEELLAEREESRPLTALQAAAAERKIVLLGGPGSGKSTFAKYLALCLAGGRLEQLGEPSELPAPEGGWLPQLQDWAHGALLPLQITLRLFAASRWCDGTAAGLWNYVAETLGSEGLADFAPHLRRQLFEGGVIVLLDGLDEVADPGKREAVRDAVDDFVATHNAPGNRYLVTCRGYAYQERCWQLEHFSTHTLAAFDQERIDAFIGSWYREVRRQGWKSAVEAEDLTRRLQEATRRPDLAPLAGSPLQLTMMASLHFSWGKLPDDRAELYQEMVRLLLVRWQEGRLGEDVGVTQAVGARELEEALGRVALIAHRAQERPEGTADIGEEQLRSVLKDYLGEDWSRAGELVGYIKQRAGLLGERGPGVYTFPHRSYQEYLAGSCLEVQPDFPDEAAALVEENYGQWREVVLWAVAVAARLKRHVHTAVDVAAALCPRDVPDPAASETDWRNAHLAGEALLETGLKEVRARERYRPVLERVQRWLAALLQRGALTPPERAAAGRTLGLLGDPRFRPDAFYLPDEPLLGFLEVPAGPFQMGSKEGDPGAYNNEFPQFDYPIPYPYYIARYPVTNAQFQAFVEAGGCREPDYWTEAEAAGVWSPQGVKGRRDEEPRRGTADEGEPWNLPNHPVVNVTWYEALAYGRWLTERLREWPGTPGPLAALLREQDWAATLPSETQWEEAARGGQLIPGPAGAGEPALVENPHPARHFPWGDVPDPDRANYDESGVGSTSAVGCFPGGRSPYGALDMSGNVWEWCLTQWRENYRDYRQHEDNDPAGDAPRVLRGGAFDLSQWSVRCAFRYWYRPRPWYGYLGFRVVLVPR